METQNITLSLPKDMLLKVKLLAVQCGTSVSGLLASELDKLVAQEGAYGRAQQRHLERLANTPDQGTSSRLVISRGELHEHKPVPVRRHQPSRVRA